VEFSRGYIQWTLSLLKLALRISGTGDWLFFLFIFISKEKSNLYLSFFEVLIKAVES